MYFLSKNRIFVKNSNFQFKLCFSNDFHEKTWFLHFLCAMRCSNENMFKKHDFHRKSADIMANYETKNMMSKQQLRKTYKTKENILFHIFLNPCKTMRIHDFHANIANTRSVASSSIQPVFEKGGLGYVGAEWCFCGHQKMSSWGDVGRGVRARTPVTRFFISSRVYVHAMSAISFRKAQRAQSVIFNLLPFLSSIFGFCCVCFNVFSRIIFEETFSGRIHQRVA